MDIVPDEFSLRELSDGWHERMIVLAEQKEIELVMRIEEDVPPILYGDTQRITQIAVNLLSNAIKFTGEGSVTMHARWQAEALVMDFIDTGVGIPPHALMYIFDEFRQVDGSSKRTHGGTGLGLSIVSKLAKAMGGTVTVESELGVGSTFTVILPLPIHAPETEVIEEKQG